MRVLVVEDEAYLAEAIGTGLRREGMAVDVAIHGDAAAEFLELYPYDLVVLDRDLPGRSGDEICRDLCREKHGPLVLMLTAAASVDDRVDGLGLGADDYLVKPFAFRELVARVHTLTRRGGAHLPPVLQMGDLRLDPVRRQAWRRRRSLELSRNEFAILEILMRADGAVVSAEELLDRVWDESVDPFTNTVRVAIMRLRRKLGEPPAIRTVPGAGYRLG